MSKNTKAFKMLIGALLIIIGVASIIIAWFILLTTNTHNWAIPALEIGGVAVCLIGYFMWKKCRSPEKEVETKDLATQVYK